MDWRIGWVPFSALLAAQTAQAQSVGYEEILAVARGEQPVLEAGALRKRRMSFPIRAYAQVS